MWQIVPYSIALSHINSGRSREGAWGTCSPPPLFLDQTEAQKAKKKFFGDHPPPPLSKGLDDRAPTYLKVWIQH